MTSRQAQRERRRRELGDKRVGVWLEPEEQAILARHKPETGSDEETLRRALILFDLRGEPAP